MIVWLWDADGPDTRLIGVCGIKEDATAQCERLLLAGTVTFAAVELATLRFGGVATTCYELSGFGWSASRDSSGNINWVSFEETRDKGTLRKTRCALTMRMLSVSSSSFSSSFSKIGTNVVST